ncbi:MAG: DUF3168 domain-containing protein [Comamonas sp.]|jgi:hypothetical protein|uniref:tail completion protein gp17 n=1 Tax=Comamonas sp. TaxID=34028 RepID=UPI0028339B6D|nr:DUF3168 domain-containing protein [Comamonas sp.]MDR0215618.1 DUF3168 domain-containing protein [Comamonas sp.]
MEDALIAALEGVCGSVYPAVAPHEAVAPYITWQQTGGRDTTYLDNQAGPRNARVQINVWASTPKDAAALRDVLDPVLRDLEELICAPVAAHSATHDSDTGLYGVQQTWGIWS